MLFWIFEFVVLAAGTELSAQTVKKQSHKIEREIVHSVPFTLQKDMYFEVQDFRGLGRSIDLHVQQTSPVFPVICWPFQSSVRVYHAHDNVQILEDQEYVDLDNLSVEDLERDAGERLIFMVHVKDGVVVSSNNRIFHFTFEKQTGGQQYKVTKKSVKEFEKIGNQTEMEIPQLVYDSVSQHVYLVYTNFVYSFLVDQVESDFKLQSNWKTRDALSFVRVFNGVLYVCVQDFGIDAYVIDPKTGNLSKPINIDAATIYPGQPDQYINIIDVAIAGAKNEFLYVLDARQGVYLFDVVYGKTLRITHDKKFGSIPLRNGIAFEVYEHTLIVVSETRLSSLVVEYYLDHQVLWFELNRYVLKGRVRDVDITKDFAILTGIDSHRIVYHSIYQSFKHSASDQSSLSYFYSGGLQQLDFFRSRAGVDDAIFGINEHSLIIYQWQELTPTVACLTYGEDVENQQFIFSAQYNTTDCPEKHDLLQKKVTYDPLVMCQTKEDFIINVVAPLITDRERDTIIYLLIGILGLILLIVCGIFVCYRRYQIRKEELENQLKTFETRAKRQVSRLREEKV